MDPTAGNIAIDIGPATKVAYDSDGFVVIPNLIDAELVHTGGVAAERILDDPNVCFEFNRRTPIRKQPGGTWYVEKIDPISDIADPFAQINRDSNVLALARTLLGSADVRVFKDKLIIKRPGQDGYPLHQDYNWWHEYDPDKILTIAIAFDRATEENGAIEFFPGLHREILLPHGTYGEIPIGTLTRVEQSPSVVPELGVADAVAFHSLAPHCSGRNLSRTTRRIYYVSMCDGSVGDAFLEHHERHWRKMEAGLPEALRERMCFI
jgi:ectoine hydroxylase-related dioxygenase (phytanoyl-CoA dioxygenase family)